MIKNVITFIDGSEASLPWLAKAVEFCRPYGARLHVSVLMERVPLEGRDAFIPAYTLETDFAPLGEDTADIMFPAGLANDGVPIEVSRVWNFFSELPLRASQQSRVMDIALISPGSAWSDPLLRRRVTEQIVTDAGTPVMVVPEGWNAALIRTVTLGWNGSSQASRAARALAPLAEQGARVDVVVIKDAAGLQGQESCTEIAGHLANQGFKVEADVLLPDGEETAEMLENFASGHDAQLLVVGGYGRPRLLERLFGGVSRDLIAEPHMPVLMVG